MDVVDNDEGDRRRRGCLLTTNDHHESATNILLFYNTSLGISRSPHTENIPFPRFDWLSPKAMPIQFDSEIVDALERKASSVIKHYGTQPKREYDFMVEFWGPAERL